MINMIGTLVINGLIWMLSLHKKRRFLLRVSSVNLTKSAINCGFDHIYHSHKKRKDSLETRAAFSSILILT